ncbi:MAG: insulinase family protein, partial [Clostridia bacterium]|nr:insulinase family protein [Clostridia bacterium]
MLQQTLPSQIRTVALPMPHTNSVTVCFFVRAGAVYETHKAAGLSHFIEHMLFKGTQNRTAAQQAADIDGVGGQINAYTAKENTCYYVRLLPENLPLAFDILSDMLLRPALPEEEIEREKGVILEEISMVEDTPDDVAHEALTEAFFQGHPLARPILGTPKSVQGITKQDIQAYMQKHYGARDTVVSVAGRFEEQQLNDLYEKHLNTWPASSVQKRVTGYEWQKPQQRIHKKKTIEQAHICLGYPGLAMGDDDTYALMALNNILGGGMSSRLFQKIREERGL